MKTLYGVQLGNYLRINQTNEIRKVIGLTKKKIGINDGGGNTRYYYLPDISGIPLTLEILEKYKEVMEDYKKIGDEVFFIIPEGSSNLYTVRWFHELQNVLELHNHRIQWID